jgi:hypothetical protein
MISRHPCVVGGVAHDQQQEGSLALGPAEDAVEKAHGAGGVGQGGQARVVQGGDEEAAGQAHRLLGVVVGHPFAALVHTMALLEDGDQPGRGLEEGLPPAGAQGLEVVQPAFAGPAGVEGLLLFLGGLADGPLHGRIADDLEAPGLAVGAAGRLARRLDAGPDHRRRHRAAAEVAHGAAGGQLVAEGLGPLEHGGVVVLRARGQGHGAVVVHRDSFLSAAAGLRPPCRARRGP